MKRTLTILITLVVGILFFGCEGDNSTNSDSVAQIMFVHAEHRNYYWDNQSDEEVFVENTMAWGVVFGDPIPEFNYFKLGETTFSGDDYYEYYPGFVNFSPSYYADEPAMITSNFNPLSVEVKTSLGKLSGSISLPDTIISLELSEYDTLQIDESFTISWPESNAEFYSVYCDYEWRDENGNWHWEDLSDFVTGNSITYLGSIFLHNGEIDYIVVQPMNGPLPEAGAEGNMSGDGSGFLYYEVEAIRHYEEIIVGTGMYGGMAKMSPDKPSDKEIQGRIRQEIEKRIIGNQ